MYRNLLAVVIAFCLIPSYAQTVATNAEEVARFRAAPTAVNASAVADKCPTVSSSVPVNTRYDEAVARRKCLEQAQLDFVAEIAAPASGDDVSRSRAVEDKQGVSIELLKTQQKTEAAKEEEKKVSAEKSFMGSNWALGLGYSFGQGAKRITEAEVVNGVVRVKQDDTDQPIVLLEVHRLFQVGRNGFAWGPFASIQTGSDDAMVGFGGGLQFGWRDPEPKSAGGFLLGVGYGWTHGVKTLGDGIVANQPLPAGETEIRYKNQSAESIFVFVSRRFDISGGSK